MFLLLKPVLILISLMSSYLSSFDSSGRRGGRLTHELCLNCIKIRGKEELSLINEACTTRDQHVRKRKMSCILFTGSTSLEGKEKYLSHPPRLRIFVICHGPLCAGEPSSRALSHS